jgi:hypothetical protein
MNTYIYIGTEVVLLCNHCNQTGYSTSSCVPSNRVIHTLVLEPDSDTQRRRTVETGVTTRY